MTGNIYKMAGINIVVDIYVDLHTEMGCVLLLFKLSLEMVGGDYDGLLRRVMA